MVVNIKIEINLIFFKKKNKKPLKPLSLQGIRVLPPYK